MSRLRNPNNEATDGVGRYSETVPPYQELVSEMPDNAGLVRS